MKTNKFTRLFNIKKPFLRQLLYEQVIIGQNPYLLISWESINATKLSIKALGFCSRRPKGSAYMAIPGEVSVLKLKVSSFWRKHRLTIELKKTLLDRQVDYTAVMKVIELPLSVQYKPAIVNKFSTPPVPRGGARIRTVNMHFAIKSSKIKYGK
ncbi:hypothetical protein ACFQZI_10365 [Mucilaginibacter lutimaris]|uniref:Uncharacterized protein n=1 Tax=Mucilaginibacter lutimaris TaxID=931629 RepID=A0ABW2ZGC0_9SPHI